MDKLLVIGRNLHVDTRLRHVEADWLGACGDLVDLDVWRLIRLMHVDTRWT